MKAYKFVSKGNDFIITFDDLKDVKLVSTYCDKHLGVSADGLIKILYNEDYDCQIKIYNNDGSIAKVSGNGLLCVGEFLRHFNDKKDQFLVKSDSNDHVLNVLDDGDIEVKIGKPKKINQIENELLFNIINIGNDHVVRVVDKIENCDFDKFVLEVKKEVDYNIEIVEIIDKSNIKIRVHERGVGETLSCGSGACASVFALYKQGLVDESVSCHFPGGILKVRIDKEDYAYLKGRAKLVFKGELYE